MRTEKWLRDLATWTSMLMWKWTALGGEAGTKPWLAWMPKSKQKKVETIVYKMIHSLEAFVKLSKKTELISRGRFFFSQLLIIHVQMSRKPNYGNTLPSISTKDSTFNTTHINTCCLSYLYISIHTHTPSEYLYSLDTAPYKKKKRGGRRRAILLHNHNNH